jgi:hypothetical protein
MARDMRRATARASLLTLPEELLALALARADARADHLAIALACVALRDAAARARANAPLRTAWPALWTSAARARWAVGALCAPLDARASAAAAAAGALETLEWLRAQTPPCPWNERACEAAASHGQLETLRWMLTQPQPCPFDAKAYAHVRSRGDPELVVRMTPRLDAIAARYPLHKAFRIARGYALLSNDRELAALLAPCAGDDDDKK